LGKYPLKYFSFSYAVVQQCDSRWHCEYKCFLGCAKAKNNPFKPSLSNPSLSNPLPF
jgi:hypothetical protein